MERQFDTEHFKYHTPTAVRDQKLNKLGSGLTVKKLNSGEDLHW